MGSPFSPVLANLFMGHHEKLWLENWQGSEVLFYRRYVGRYILFISFGKRCATIFQLYNLQAS